ncbi:MAG: hypothetical protein KKB81_02540 [Candidatus Margulisbacteria bacterium]|nr:hypothetical protein [Candidatus Margulisiibacteriota bacterium]MBU1021068.1 hypothetical protein [Candidatus Margulisiibacteriota bacterium]MBU1729743.1 hypothetical protein [Candidatus Margulisiibacteriota bacterium]MBU1956008.1 hypothetical protein [Candidatus Margulisiibacteriota bacterium]
MVRVEGQGAPARFPQRVQRQRQDSDEGYRANQRAQEGSSGNNETTAERTVLHEGAWHTVSLTTRDGRPVKAEYSIDNGEEVNERVVENGHDRVVTRNLNGQVKRNARETDNPSQEVSAFEQEVLSDTVELMQYFDMGSAEEAELLEIIQGIESLAKGEGGEEASVNEPAPAARPQDINPIEHTDTNAGRTYSIELENGAVWACETTNYLDGSSYGWCGVTAEQYASTITDETNRQGIVIGSNAGEQCAPDDAAIRNRTSEIMDILVTNRPGQKAKLNTINQFLMQIYQGVDHKVAQND